MKINNQKILTPSEVLSQYFNYTEFRTGQLKIINSILSKKNVLAILPTGAGKSLCYQIPALIGSSFSIVISPLIALMKNQVDSINRYKKAAAFINSTLDYVETEKVLNQLGTGEIKLLYVSPEKLENLGFAERLKNLKPTFLFIDEAHCISEWGHDFRPSYRKIDEFSKFIEVGNIAAFTATATPDVRTDIINQLHLENPEIFIQGFERKNLSLNIIQTKQKKSKCFELINRYGTPTIIYTSTRKYAEEIHSFLSSHKINSTYYHAGLTSEVRRIVQDDFLNGRRDVICATNAFGMGIDKKDIRLIIHYNMPGSIENYYQEIGRAGRDGKDSAVFLLYSQHDKNIQEYFLNSANPSKEIVEKVYNIVCDYGEIAVGSKPEKEIQIDNKLKNIITLKGIDYNYFQSALQILSDSDYFILKSNFKTNHLLKFLLGPNELKIYVKKIAKKSLKEVILLLLRNYGSSLFQHKVIINIKNISQTLSISNEEVINNLKTLTEIGIIDYDIPTLTASIKFNTTRATTKYLQLNYERVQKRFQNSLEKLNSMLDYVFSDECRSKIILKYFGEDVKNFKCKKCDNCLNTKRSNFASNEYINEIILRTIYENKSSIQQNRLVKILLGKSKIAGEKRLSTFAVCTNYNKENIEDAVINLKTKNLINVFNNTLTFSDKGKNYFTTNFDDKNEIVNEKDYESRLELFNELRKVRSFAAKKFSQTSDLICRDEILRKVADSEPETPSELLSIEGISRNMYNKIGDEIIRAVRTFHQAHTQKTTEISNGIPQNLASTLALINKGYKLDEITSLTKLPEAIVSMQIESILEYFPNLEITSLFEENELDLITKKIDKGYFDLRNLKKELPSSISYGKIRVVLAKKKLD